MKASKSQYHSSIPFSVPVNEVAHVNVDNIGFVLALRSEVGHSHAKGATATTAAAAAGAATAVAAAARSLGEKADVALDAPKPRKIGECLNSQCLVRLKVLFSEEMERAQLLQHLDLLNDSLIKATAHLQTLEGDYAQAAALQEKLLSHLTSLDVDFSSAKNKLSEATQEQRNLEEKISMANAMLRDGADDREVEVKIVRNRRKHNGIFGLQSTGQPVWSCCLRGEADGDGCIEEHSVGLRSELGANKSTLNNNRTFPHGGHPLALGTHSTMSMEHGPRVAFWSTKHEASSFSRVGKALGQASRPRPSTAKPLPHQYQHHLSHESMFGNALVGTERFASHSSLPMERKQVHAHENSDEDGFGHEREFDSGRLWTVQRPPSRGVGKVRAEQGIMKRYNRPMSSPNCYALHG